MTRFTVIRTTEDGTRGRVGPTYWSRRDAEDAIRDMEWVTRGAWTFEVTTA